MWRARHIFHGIHRAVAIYAIGDIQGCFDSLQALLRKLPLKNDDEIWLCGDLVNRGPKSAEVLRWAMSDPRVITVLGNHDLHLLSAAAGVRKRKARDSFQDVLEAADRQPLLDWLQRQPLLHRSGEFVLVHAGLHPLWSVDKAASLALECENALRESRWLPAWGKSRPTPPVWSESLAGDARLAAIFSSLVGIRTVYPDHRIEVGFAGPPSERPDDSQPWYYKRQDNETIVFGHWAALGLHLAPKQIGLDTGCVWGNALTAVRLDDREVYRQTAVDSY